MSDLVADFEADTASGVLAEVEHPGVGAVVSTHSPIRESGEYGPTGVAPSLGVHSAAVLADVLGFGDGRIAELRAGGVVAAP